MTVRGTIVGRVDAEVLRFTAGEDTVLDLVLAEPDCIGSAAHVTMLSRLPASSRPFTPRQAQRVIAELVRVMRQVRRGAFAISERDQDVHLAVERVLTRRLGDLGRRVHTARSRNDQVAVDLRLYAKEQLLGVIDEAMQLADVLLRFARRHAALPMVGRTHQQPAMPGSVGLWASAHAESLLDDAILLTSAFRLNDRCPLGSAAGYGVPLPIDRELTSRLLGFEAPHHNVLYASNARGKCESALLAAMGQVMLTLSRLAEDLIFYALPEIGYFSLPTAYCTGSSIMPQKRNPDVLELVRARSARVLGAASTVAAIVRGLPGGYNRDLQETKSLFIEGFETTRACLRIMAALGREVNVHRAALKRGFTPQVFATDRALELVREGWSFRDAYDHVRSHVGELEEGDPVRALKAKTHLGAPAGLDFAALQSRARETRAFVRKARGCYHRAVRRLLGVPYPELGAGSAGRPGRQEQEDR